MVNIKVAVRIRPLSKRELLQGEDIVVRKENKFVLVSNPKVFEKKDGDHRRRVRKFAVDFCYDPNGPGDSSQEAVFKEIGMEVLDSMFEGYNACVLAYGHSASGKTYTVMGLQKDPGLTPRLCQGLFEKLNGLRLVQNIQIQIAISFLEIYNEKVRDLLGCEETGGNFGNFSLRVREHPKLGPYVQGLSEHAVGDERKLLKLLKAGNTKRSTASTENNSQSSRSHAVFTIHFKQSDGENFETEKLSKVHLVDLAGSERADSSQTKARLKEGANINKSLVTLGNVISALAESYESNACSKKSFHSKSWKPFVPYRDSVLTWLLKDTLGGNSHTIMIATVSPASGSLTETINTLRYAKRTKRIANQPVVNEDPKVRTIRELRKEISALKRLLFSFQSGTFWNEFEKNNSEETVGFSSPESKWLDPGREKVTIDKELQNGKEKWTEVFAERTKEKKEKSDHLKSATLNEECVGAKAAPPNKDAREINDENKTDVCELVNDNFSHEIQVFPDSLESFSSALFRHDSILGDGRQNFGQVESWSSEKLNMSLSREFGSREKLPKKDFFAALHRSRPDLIKGISTRSQEGFFSGTSQSCTDLSNLSRTDSEIFLSSSESLEIQHKEKNTSRGREVEKSMALEFNEEVEAERKKNCDGNEVLHESLKKKEKRLEIVEAVTSRLYVTKKKPSSRTELYKNEGKQSDEIQESKLCKRARMRLFDVSRKLAMTRRIKKAVDHDTQTDCLTGTLRVKEKCVTTELSGAETGRFREIEGSEESSQEQKKPCVIMNQVFLPPTSNCVLECGQVVRIGTPGDTGDRQESATQTALEDRSLKNAQTSPVKFSSGDEDCFSDDSLELEDQNRKNDGAFSKETVKVNECKLGSELKYSLSCHMENNIREGSIARNYSRSKAREGILFEEIPSILLAKKKVSRSKEKRFPDKSDSEGSRKEDSVSSDDSLTSTEEADFSRSSLTSSEEFVFYESPKVEEALTKSNATSNRELYTIAENSEQSDLGEAFTYAHSQNLLIASNRVENEGIHDRGERSESCTCPDLFQKKGGREMAPEAKGVEGNFPLRQEHERKKQMANFNLSDESDFASSQATTKYFPLSSFDTGFECFGREHSGNETFRREGDESERENLYVKDLLNRPGDDKAKSKETNWADLQKNYSKQYLNLNISSNSTVPPFSVDTHLFESCSKKDQSTDTMFNSSDSITLVFMGPAESKTSVLMELIRRSLGKSYVSSNARFTARRKSRSRGVQCDTNLMRSVSVDTAMTALSRIAKNQKSSSKVQKTFSLEALDSSETMNRLERGKPQGLRGSSCQCDFQANCLAEKKKKSALKYSAECAQNKNLEKKKLKKTEKSKKSVSWSGETEKKGRRPLKEEASDFGLTYRDFPEPDTDESSMGNSLRLSPESDLSERRVRFLKPRTRDLALLTGTERPGESIEADPNLRALLRGVTELLKNVNARSSKSKSFSDCSVGAESVSDSNDKKKEKEKSEILEPLGGCWRPKASIAGSGRKSEEILFNSTWPRKRVTAGKPPTAMKTKCSRASGFSSRSVSLHSEGFSNLTEISPQRGGTESRGVTWNLSNHSMGSANSYLAGDESGPARSRLRQSSEIQWLKEPSSSSIASPKSNMNRLINLDSVSELEAELEESCRRLEIAAEQDEMREKLYKQKTAFGRHETGLWVERCDSKDGPWSGRKKTRKIFKRRNAGECAGNCTCGSSKVGSCKYFWPKGCRSSFELDSFGPGSTHCHQKCMFCRKKEAESYCSVLSLNSECSPGLCRLSCYGFCPCSSVRLAHVAPSPRAYMQRLLALRRRIVGRTNCYRLNSPSLLPNEQNEDFYPARLFSNE